MRLSKNPDTGWFTEFGVTEYGEKLRLTRVHDPKLCEGRGCAIHDHPSDHPLKDAPLNWREDRGILERICEHGIGHGDRDAVLYTRSVGGDSGSHACDGCCFGEKF